MRLPVLVACVLPALVLAQDRLPASLHFQRGPVNSVVVGSTTAIYAAPPHAAGIQRVLLTQARREAIGALPDHAEILVPAADLPLFQNPSIFWEALETSRFHDYAQHSTRVPVRALAQARAVEDGETLTVEGIPIRALETPGYTPHALSYLIQLPGHRIVCTGDLIFGDGQLLDLYSLQDAVPEAKARGYHGYAARAGALIASLRKIAAEHPDVLLPAHGPPVYHPQQAIALLIDRLQTFLQSHFGTDALRWYWGDDNLRIRSRAVEKPLDLMPLAQQAKLPPDIVAIGNTRVILSRSGAAFVVDAGYHKTLPELLRMKASGAISGVEGIWITHYHDDHTDFVNDVASAFQAPVYFTQAMTEVLTNPAAFHLPCLTTKPIPITHAQPDGQSLRWHEWQFTFWKFPGQTLYHGGLLARRDDGQTYLFTGDSFTPTGMDDYCMQNRDFFGVGEGYAYCLRKLSTLPPHTWLLNQHVEPMFRFTDAQRQRMSSEWEKRSATLQGLSPWPDINFMVDDSWARVFPYGQQTRVGQIVTLALRIRNHAPRDCFFHVKWHPPAGLLLIDADVQVRIAAHQEGAAQAQFRAITPGLQMPMADIAFEQWELPEWAEAMVRVSK